jgi:hypothetical protein
VYRHDIAAGMQSLQCHLFQEVRNGTGRAAPVAALVAGDAQDATALAAVTRHQAAIRDQQQVNRVSVDSGQTSMQADRGPDA